MGVDPTLPLGTPLYVDWPVVWSVISGVVVGATAPLISLKWKKNFSLKTFF